MAFKPPAPDYIGPANRHGGRGNKPIERIVIHATVSACAKDADGIANYFKRTTVPASAHYVVDAKRTIQSLFDSFVGFHAPPNGNSLGVELCCTLGDQGRGHWQRKDHQKMLRRAAALTAGLCLAYDVPIRKISPAAARAGAKGIMGHNDVRDAWGQTTHWDPGPHFPWRDFLRMVLEEAQKIRSKGGRHKATKEPVVSLRRLKRAAKRPKWRRGRSKKTLQDVRVVKRALEEEGAKNYLHWQKSTGQKDPNGVPDEESLTLLGRKHGFRVSE